MTDQNEEDIFGLSLSRAMKATISPDALGDEFAERILAGVRSSRRRRARRRRLGTAAVMAVLAGVSFAAVRAFMDGAFSTGSPPVASDGNADVASMVESNSETYSETQKGNNEMKLASGTRGIAAASMMAAAMLATSAGAAPVDATLKGGASFAKPQAWVESVVPGGDGATISLLPKGYQDKGYSPWTYFDTNAVIGHVVVPLGATAATGHLTLDYTTWMTYVEDEVAPLYNGRRQGLSTNVLTLAAGPGESCGSIEHLQALVDYSSWIDVETPLVLASDLFVRHSGKKKAYATPAYAVNLAGGISTDGGVRNVVVSNDVARKSLFLTARTDIDGGTFRLLCGGLRLGNAGGYPGSGDQLGVNTTVDASSGTGWLDLGGNVVGADKTLLLGGLPNTSVDAASTCFGALQNNYADPAFTAVWKGPVTLKSETSVGGCANIGKLLDVGGDLRIEGAISEENAGTPLHVMTRRNVELAGANTYSGGTVLDDGFLVVKKLENIGTGGLTFNGGTLRILENGAEDVSQRTISVGSSKWARFDVAEGVTYTLAGDINFGSGRFAKSGRGKLVVKGANTATTSGSYAADGGEIVLDYTENGGAKIMPSTQSSTGAILYLSGSTKLTAVTKSGTDCQINRVSPRDCAWPTIRAEGDGTFVTYRPDVSANGAMLTVDAAEGAQVGFTPTGPNADKGTLFSENVLWKDETWARTDSYNPRRFSAHTTFATEWDEDNIVDVTAAMAASVPQTAFTAKALRFNDPSVTELTLPDGVVLSYGTILVTANRGSVPLTIRGGTIARSSDGVLRVLNFSDAPVTIESAFVNNGYSVGFLSRGKVALTGANTFSSRYFYVLGGELEMVGQSAFGVPNSSFRIYLNMGGILKTHGDVCLADPAGNGTLVDPQVVVQSEGGGICVADGSFDISAAKNGTSERLALVTIQTGQFVKSGVGTLVMTSGVYEAQNQSGSSFNRDYMRRIAVTGGTFDLGASRDAPSVLGRQPLVISASGGATFVNAFMAHAANGSINDFSNRSQLVKSGTPEDDGGGWTMDVGEGGAVVDVAGVSVNMGQIGVYQNSSTPVSGSTFMTPRAAGYFCGGGDLTITNSSETAAVLYPMAMKATNFCGRLTSYVPFNGDENRGRGIEMPMAELHVPAGVAHAFGRLSYPKFKVAFAGLTGTGSVTVKSDSVLASYTDAAAVIGADDGKTYSFDGVFAETETVGSGGIKYMASRLIKVGANTQRLTNPENVFYASTTVRGGRLVAGAEGAVGSTMILLGDGESCSADTPEFVTDVAGTFGNEIRAVPSAAALPTVGGIQQSGTAVFTGNVTLWRDLALVAEGGDVRFDGTFTVHGGAMLVKKGGGTVALAHNISDLGGLVWEGGKVTSTGSVSFGEGASIALGLDPRELDKSRRYVILEAAGGISDAPVGSLANGWVLSNSGSRVVLCYPGALTLLIR